MFKTIRMELMIALPIIYVDANQNINAIGLTRIRLKVSEVRKIIIRNVAQKLANINDTKPVRGEIVHKSTNSEHEEIILAEGR